MLYTSLPVCFLVIGAALCAPERVQSEHDHEHDIHESHDTRDTTNDLQHVALEKRSPHDDYGLAKRAYSYVSEYKRLPVYQFGLGKRSRPFSFGLGKRSVDEDQSDEAPNDIDQETQEEFFDQYDEQPGFEKRARPYGFGLGKRSDDDLSEEKRAGTYNFGLGKRIPVYNFGLGKRSRAFSFGLGKRLSSKFNFGIGKRERDLHRFNFGLGKRSADYTTMDDSDSSYDV